MNTILPKICVPVVATNWEEANQQILLATETGADLLELRVDYLEGAEPSELKAVLATAELPVIVTPRARVEGGQWDPPEYERLAWSEAAIEYEAAYVDLEFATDHSYLKSIIHFQDHTQIILSFHDFRGTPPLEELQAKLDKMTGLDNHAVITKFACRANSAEDATVMRKLLAYAKTRHQPILVTTMGEYARESRVEFPLQGSLWAYAALDENHISAPGQLTIKEWRAINDARSV